MSLQLKRLLPSHRLAQVPLALLLGWGAAASQAQSLKEVYQAALTYDTTYIAARALAESVTYRVEQTYALTRPSVGLAAGITHVETDAPQVDPTTGVRQQARYGTSSGQLAVNAKYPIFNRGNSLAVEQAVKSLDLAKADLDTAAQDLILRVSAAYFDVLAAQDTLGLTRASKAAITEQLASAKRSFEVGTASITDTREAQARYDLATAQEIAADNDLRTKRAALDQLVGRIGVQPKLLAAPFKLPSMGPTDVEQWVTNALDLHPQIRKTRALFEIAKFDTSRADAAGYPTLDLVGSVDTSRIRGSGDSPSGTGNISNATVGVQFNMPLYAGGAIENRKKETVALEEKARNDLESTRRAVTLGTRQLFFGVQSGQAQVLALEAAESSSKLALEATQLGYKVGVRVNLDVLNAQTQLFLTQRDLARARYDVIVAALRLRQASGQLDETDIDVVNTLLAP